MPAQEPIEHAQAMQGALVHGSQASHSRRRATTAPTRPAPTRSIAAPPHSFVPLTPLETSPTAVAASAATVGTSSFTFAATVGACSFTCAAMAVVCACTSACMVGTRVCTWAAMAVAPARTSACTVGACVCACAARVVASACTCAATVGARSSIPAAAVAAVFLDNSPVSQPARTAIPVAQPTTSKNRTPTFLFRISSSWGLSATSEICSCSAVGALSAVTAETLSLRPGTVMTV